MYEWRTGRSCVFKNNIHLVFVTKYRRNVLTLEMLASLEAIFTETCTEMDCEKNQRKPPSEKQVKQSKAISGFA